MEQDIINRLINSASSLPPSQEEEPINDRYIPDEPEVKKQIHPEFSLDLINQKSINVLGFNLYFDDIIILALILFLMQEEHKDYILICVLGLMFFDFSIDKIKNFEPINKLFNSFS